MDNYVRIFSDYEFGRSMFNTLIFVVVTTPVSTIFALLLAMLISESGYFENFFRSVFFLPSIISIVVTSTIFKSFYSPVGTFNRILQFIGIEGQGWLVETHLALPSIILINIWAFTGYYMVLFLAALKSVPRSMYEAADIDGANDLQKFIYITVPQIKYMIIFVLVINGSRNWQAFPEIYTLTGGGPLGRTNTLVHHLYQTAFRYHEMGYASALAYVLLFVIVVFSFIQVKIIKGRHK